MSMLGRRRGCHDCDAGSVDPNTVLEPRAQNTLSKALSNVHLDGAIFLRAEYTDGWAYKSPPAADLAGLLRPGRKRLVLFHIVSTGSCWVSVESGEKHHAQEGDVIILPYGDQHTMSGNSDAVVVPIAGLLAPLPWTEFPVIQYGAGGPRTDVVCGYLDADGPLFDPNLRALPSVFVVRPSGAAAGWVQASIGYALEQSTITTGSNESVTSRLPELLLTEILRIYLASTPSLGQGWLAALHDPVLAPALAALHKFPERKWTIADLANESAVSRSVLDEQFRKVLGQPPIRYLTEWRMHLAQQMLTETNLLIATVAHKTGYDSVEAFSRAFKRSRGIAPSQWKTARDS